MDEKYYDKLGLDYEDVIDFRNHETIDHLSSSSVADIAGIGRANSTNNPLMAYDMSNAETNYGGFYQPEANKVDKKIGENSENIKSVGKNNSLKIKQNNILIQEDLEA